MNVNHGPSPNDQVKRSLERLRKQLGSWLDAHPELAEVQEILDAVDIQELVLQPEREEHVRSLINLARETIRIRLKARKTDLSSPLNELEVPPYDLWLPFKIGTKSPL